MVEMIANRQIHGKVRVAARQRFFVSQETAQSYAERGIADYYYPPAPRYVPPNAGYETKPLGYETKPLQPIPPAVVIAQTVTSRGKAAQK